MKVYDKNKESLYLQYWDVCNLYGQANKFKWVKCIFKFDKCFIKQ